MPAVWRLDIWYEWLKSNNKLPAEVAGMSLREVESFLGLGHSARKAKVFEQTLTSAVERVETGQGEKVIAEWHSDKGSLRKVVASTAEDQAAGIQPTIVEHPIKTIDDYAIFEEVMQATMFTADYDSYRAYDAEVGDSGLPLVILHWIPFHEILVQWTGYEAGYVHLFDAPEVFLHAVEVANDAYSRRCDIVADSPGELVMHGANFDAMITPPPVFREHFLPYAKRFNDKMHAKGKKVACHADGNMRGLLDLVVEAGYDVADCFACYPMVECTLAEARESWRDKVTIWGGIPSPLLEPSTTIDALDNYLAELDNAIGSNDRFILGLADQAMPTASWENIKHAAQWIAKRNRGG